MYSVEVRGPAGMTVFADAAPFVAAAPPRRSRSDGGRLVRIEQRLLCLDRACAPDRRSRLVSLPRVRVVSGGVPTLGARVSRHRRAARARSCRQGVARAVSSRQHRQSSRRAVANDVRCPRGARDRRSARGGTDARPAGSSGGKPVSAASAGRGGLAHALRLLRESARRPVPDRRRAADYVARAVPCDRGDAAAEASRIAWSAPDPQPPEVVALADRVEGASDT